MQANSQPELKVESNYRLVQERRSCLFQTVMEGLAAGAAGQRVETSFSRADAGLCTGNTATCCRRCTSSVPSWALNTQNSTADTFKINCIPIDQDLLTQHICQPQMSGRLICLPPQQLI